MKNFLLFLLPLVFLMADEVILSPIEDVYISTFGGGEGLNTFMKFDISTIPAGYTIDSVFLSVFVYQVNANWDGDADFWNVNDQTWTEATSANTLWVRPTSDLTSQASGFGTVNGWTKSVDLKQIFLTDYNVSNTFCSIKMKDPDDPTFMVPPGSMPFDRDETLGMGNRVFGQHIYFYPHEYVNSPPWLTVYYTTGGKVEEEKTRNMNNKNLKIGIYPNPFRNHCVIKYQIPNPKHPKNSNIQIPNDSEIRNSQSEISLKIYDATGRQVKQFNDLTNCSFNQIVWSGSDDSGRKLSSGIYFVCFEEGDFRLIEKAVLLR